MAVGFREAASLLGGERSAISGRGRQNKLPGEDVPACQAQTFESQIWMDWMGISQFSTSKRVKGTTRREQTRLV
jgi:hypothetical protein